VQPVDQQVGLHINALYSVYITYSISDLTSQGTEENPKNENGGRSVVFTETFQMTL
jgi:hypothetical protein